MAPQGYNPQGWGMPSYGQQQQWGGPPSQGGGDASNQSSAPVAAPAATAGGVGVNSSSGQPDYSVQWAEYYR